MVAAVRQGESMRSVARRGGVSLLTVQRWVRRAQGHALDHVDWSDQPSVPHHTGRTAAEPEEVVLTLRQELKAHSDLREWGAVAIHRELVARGYPTVPAGRTIGRILERGGALDARVRVRRRPPPLGWYLADVAAGQAEIASIDVVEGLVIKDGPSVEVLTAISVHGGLVSAWPQEAISAQVVTEALVARWREWGRPTYAQFDNDTRFQGPHQHPDVIGRVMRLCLSLDIVPVFAPPRESGFQAAIESCNGRWQAKVWVRFLHESLPALQAQSDRYVRASHHRNAVRIEAAPARRPFPADWRLNLQAHPHGRLIYLRRTDAQGAVSVLGHSFTVDRHWLHRLVRAEVDLDAAVVRFHALRRRDPTDQPLLQQTPYALPRRRFRE
jgi:transposase-like protein